MNMIYDRSLDDVNSAKDIRENKVKKFLTLTSEEIQTLERGCITINTLNRIESKQSELKEKINNMGYFNTPIINKTWSKTDIFYEEDIARIVNNNLVLKEAFFVFNDTPFDAKAQYDYIQINKLEKTLYDIELLTEEVINLYRICGTFSAASSDSSYTNLVPTLEALDSTAPYNGCGYKNGKYCSSGSSPYEGNDPATVITGLLPYGDGRTTPIYVMGVTISSASHVRIHGYSSNKAPSIQSAAGATLYNYFTIEELGQNYYKVTPTSSFTNSSGYSNYLRFSFIGTGENMIITLNEPIL